MKQKGHFRWAIVGGILPLGFILYYKWRKTRPGDAKYALHGALFSLVANGIITVALLFVQMFTGYTAIDLINMLWHAMFGRNLLNF